MEAATLAGGRLTGSGTEEITSVSIHSGRLTPGALFVALPGERTDGHDYMAAAFANGAAACMGSRVPEGLEDRPVVLVPDPAEGLLALGAGWRQRFDIPVVGLTGSVGKTTTKEMTAAVLSARYRTLKTEGNLNNHLGVPLTLCRMSEEAEAAVVEMGMSGFGEIERLARAVRPTVAMVLNIGVSHIGMLGSREGILRAKMEIVQGLRPDGPLIVNGDEPLLMMAVRNVRHPIVTFGLDTPGLDLSAWEIREEEGRTVFTAVWRGEPFPVRVAAVGIHNVKNALAALAAGLSIGLSPEEAAAGLATYAPPPMRQQIYERNGFVILEDCYNASPDSIEAALSVLQTLPGEGRRFAVLGGIRELGDYAPAIHRTCGRMAADAADLLYFFGEGAEEYREGALKAGADPSKVHVFSDRAELARALRKEARPGDRLLFKGSRMMKMEEALRLFLEGDR